MSTQDLPVYLMTDQPTTCPMCGTRTDFEVRDTDQLHTCPSTVCGYVFLVEEDDEDIDSSWVDNRLCGIYAAIGINTPDSHQQIIDFIVADLTDLQIDDPSDADISSSFRRVLEHAFDDHQ